MKVVQVIPNFQLGGIQKAGVVMAGELAKLGHEAMVIGRDGGPRYLDQTPDGLTHRVSESQDEAGYAREILAFDPDAIHIHGPAYDEPLVEALSAAGARVDGAPLLISTPVFGRPPESRAILKKTRTAVVGTYILYRLRHWLGMSLDKAFENGVVHQPVVSFQATDPPHSTLESEEVRATRRAEFGLPADAFVIGRIGRATPEKWHPANIPLIDRFLASHPNGAWLSVGCPLEDEIGGLKKKWGDRVVSLPQSSDYDMLARAFASMDVQVFMSCAGECFAATICEPAGVGLPTIATANPVKDNGQSEQVVEGVTGHLVGSLDGALQRVDALVADPEALARLKRSTHDYAHSRWTPAQITTELVETIEAWLGDDPLATPRMRRLHDEAAAFDAGYLPRLLDLYGKNARSRAWWNLKLAAVRNWRTFQLAASIKRKLG